MFSCLGRQERTRKITLSKQNKYGRVCTVLPLQLNRNPREPLVPGCWGRAQAPNEKNESNFIIKSKNGTSTLKKKEASRKDTPYEKRN